MPEQNNDDDMALVAAEFVRSPQEEAEVQTELEADLATLRRGEIPRKGVFDTIHNFGEERFMEALPEIKKYIISTDERLRYIALHVLTFHYQLPDYARVAMDMMKDDPDQDCRIMAINGLLSLRRNTDDQYALKELATIVRNEEEEEFVRETAYKAMHGIISYDMDEQLRLSIEPFDLAKDVDWELVNSYR
ncbi:MAG: hypothetical protein JO202_16280 [Ktedonobacteraceae bacterium]|nr:hypothetical protein [Ktedonobacteraceae bacterium]